MTDFDALLKRSFAEAHEPADDGFSVNVAHGVARSEAALKLRTMVQNVGMATAGLAVFSGIYAFVGVYGQEFLATAGLEVARIHGALSAAPSVGDAAGGTMGAIQSLGAGLTQVLLIMGALAGGAVAYRAVQQD